ncbi:MAG: hypothetical protein ABIO49_16195 [Dokdonella sp.]
MNRTREILNRLNGIGVSALLLITPLLACLLPARRACATQPRDVVA